ncbi:MAG: hypothetical protein WD005_03710, partial [Haliea sp.]
MSKQKASKTLVNYGCGLSAPTGWVNLDASPTLRLQRVFLIGKICSRMSNTKFPENVDYGDVSKR